MVEVEEEEEGEPVGREDGAGTTPMAVRRVMKSRRNAGGGAMVGGEEVGEKERMRMEGAGEVVAGMFQSASENASFYLNVCNLFRSTVFDRRCSNPFVYFNYVFAHFIIS